MTFHLSHIHDYERFLAVEIGSHRIRTGAYTIESHDGVPIGHASLRQNRKNVLRGMIADMRSVALTIERSMIQASQHIQFPPADIILGFSSSQLISDNITTQYLRTPGSVITMSEIDKMVKKVEKDSFDRVRKKAKEDHGLLHDDLKLVSSTITAIELDGRTISNPVGFDGKKIRLSILNIFAPAGEFNIIRSISAHIGKNIISLIPIPLVFPKILEKTDYGEKAACIVDVGFMHTSIICVRDGSIIALETFPFGSEMLVRLLEDQYTELTILQIEHMLCNDEYIHQKTECTVEFISYIIDMIQVFISKNVKEFDMSYMFCHGGVFESEVVKQLFLEGIHEQYNNTIKIQRFSDILNCDPEHVITSGLADMAIELLMVKKDPLVRILRYILYNYE